jgi:hypothetical protein
MWFRNEQFRNLPFTQEELSPSLGSSARTIDTDTGSNDDSIEVKSGPVPIGDFTISTDCLSLCVPVNWG